MSDPLKPHEVMAHAALTVADPDAEMRKELDAMIRAIVFEVVRYELQYFFERGSNALSNGVYVNTMPFLNNSTNMTFIRQEALRAIKQHFQNIY